MLLVHYSDSLTLKVAFLDGCNLKCNTVSFKFLEPVCLKYTLYMYTILEFKFTQKPQNNTYIKSVHYDIDFSDTQPYTDKPQLIHVDNGDPLYIGQGMIVRYKKNI